MYDFLDNGHRFIENAGKKIGLDSFLVLVGELMRIGVMSQNYPSKDNLYSSSFVHARCVGYKRKGHEVFVYRLDNKDSKEQEYTFDGIRVYKGNNEYIKKKILEHDIDIMCSQMPNYSEVKLLEKIQPEYSQKHSNANLQKDNQKNLQAKKNQENMPVIFWFHGSDGIWSSIVYPYEGNVLGYPIKFIYRLSIDVYKRAVLKKYIRAYNPWIVYVSEWMKDTTTKFLDLGKHNHRVIPNIIDEKVFKYKQRKGQVEEVVCVRPHSTTKYGLDIAIRAFKNSKYRLVIYGKGPLLKMHKKLAEKCKSNVVFVETFLTRNNYLDYTRSTIWG